MNTRNIVMKIGDKNYKIVMQGAADKKEDVPQIQSVMTVADAMELYILDAERNHTVKPSTIKTYRNFYENYFSLIRDHPLSWVSMNYIQESIDEEASHLRRAKTIRNAYSFLKKVLNVYRPDLIFTKGSLVYPGEIEGVVYKE